MPTAPPSTSSSGPWAPLSVPLFRALWIANAASMIGTWIHDVGAAWLMTMLAPGAFMVAAVQAAKSFPMFLLAIPAGAIADLVDRRRLLIATQCWMLLAVGALAALAYGGLVRPWSLLAATFALGLGAAVHVPAWQATIPELVPPRQLAAAVALGGVGLNLARAVGPAAGGFIVAAAGPWAAFALNALSFLGTIVVLARWRRPRRAATLPSERFAAAILAGIRYVRHAPALHAVLARATAYIVCASAIFALLPVLARDELKLDSRGYGALLGCLGAGAVAGAGILPAARRRLGVDAVVTIGTAGIAVGCALLARVRFVPALFPVMLAVGVSWMAVLSTLNVSAQSALPTWVRARGLSVYLLVFFAWLTGGSVLWGAVAQRAGVETAFAIASVGLLAGIGLAVRFRLAPGEALDLAPAGDEPAPPTAFPVDPARGPVLVTIDYRIDPARAGEFQAAMREVRRLRRRDGAARWSLAVDAGDPALWRETFVATSWSEHLRQRERTTVADRAVEARARAFHVGEEPPRVSRYVAVA